MHKLKKASLLLILINIFWSIPLLAKTGNDQQKSKSYQVEILAFKNLNAPISNETFTNYPVLPDYDDSVELSPDDEELIINYKKLPNHKLSLQKDANLITKKGRYELLLHESWLQSQDEELSVHLKSNDISTDILEGTIKINRAYYYKADIHFDLQSSTLATTKHYVLNIKRNLKNGEMHFIDHPQFGILLKITTL